MLSNKSCSAEKQQRNLKKTTSNFLKNDGKKKGSTGNRRLGLTPDSKFSASGVHDQRVKN